MKINILKEKAKPKKILLAKKPIENSRETLSVQCTLRRLSNDNGENARAKKMESETLKVTLRQIGVVGVGAVAALAAFLPEN